MVAGHAPEVTGEPEADPDPDTTAIEYIRSGDVQLEETTHLQRTSP